MPITVKYAPVGALLGLAQAAGIGERQQRGEVADLAFIQMSLSAQARNAEIAARMQAQDQAFALQTAAATRIARTPTRVQPTDAVLGRMQWQTGQRELQQQTQIDQLNMMRAGGQIDQAQYERAKLGLMTGNEALVRGALLPKKPVTKPLVSFAQEKSYFDDRWKRQLDPIQREIAQLQKESREEYEIRDEKGKIVPELQQQAAQRAAKITNRLNALRIHYRDLQSEKDQEWVALKQRQPTGQELMPGPTGAARTAEAEAPPIPLPPRRSMWVVGQIYVAPDGRLGRWNGQTFESVGRE